MRSGPLCLIAIAFVIGFGSACGDLGIRAHSSGGIIEKWEGQNSRFRIRVLVFEETGANVNGAYYRYESAPLGTDDWHEITTFRHDDRPKIPIDQIRFVNDEIAYFFIGWVYAVTTDGGAHWSVWNAETDLKNWQCCNYNLIRSVMLTQDGQGMMQLNVIDNRRGEVSELRSNDYGNHWQAK